MDIIKSKAEEVGHENKLFDFDLIIQEKTRKTAGDGTRIRVKKQQEIKILWKKYESGKVVGQPANESEIIQFEKDGKDYDVEIKELLLDKGVFSDRISSIAFAPQNEPVPEKSPYHVCYLNYEEFKKGISLVKPQKIGRIVGAGVIGVVSLGALLFCLVKFLKRGKKPN